MGNRYKEENSFAFYDPEQEDREGQRGAPPRQYRSAPVSPRAPISPRAQPPGLYPEPDLGYNNRSGQPGSGPRGSGSRERPFSLYDPELDRERARQGPAGSQGPVSSRPLDAEPGYAGRGVSGRGRGGGGYEDPAYIGKRPMYGDPESDYDPRVEMPAGRGAPLGRGNPEYGMDSKGVGRGAPPPPYNNQDSVSQGAPPNGSYGRGAPVEPGYAGQGVGRGGGGYGEQAAYYDANGKRPGDAAPGYSMPAGRGAPLGRGNGMDSRGVGRGAPSPYNNQDSDHLQSVSQGAPPNGSYGRGAPVEPGYAGRGVGRGGGGYGDQAAYYDVNRKRPGDGVPGYAMPGSMGRDRVPALGDGRYVYGGLQQLQRLDSAEAENNEHGAPPAPISSEYAHQVYASVFSDPVYGGAGQLNSRAGYLEEPDSLRQEHRRNDVLRHPDQF